MARFHTLKVKDLQKETADSIVIEFEIPGDLKESFQFTQGQYLTLKFPIDGEEVRRSYSICSSPVEENLKIAAKRVEGGKMSTFLNQQLEPGAEVEVMEPMGNFFTYLNEGNSKRYVAFAAGSGITPVISILKTVLHKEPKSAFTLFYGNRDSLSIIFKHELEKLMSKYEGRLDIYHILSREETKNPVLSGRIDGEKARQLVDEYIGNDRETEYFICGPEGMMEQVTGVLEEKGVDKKHIHVELFTSPIKNEKEIEEKKQARDERMEEGVEGGTAEVTVVLDDEVSSFELDYEGEAILDAALEEDLDVPFSCKGAVCSTCKAKLLEGKVEMDENHALTDEEVDEGFILTCQSHPRTPKVKVDYDEI